MKRKAIITFAVGYQFEHIQHFILSCQTFCPDADLFIYVGSNIRDLQEQCKSFSNVKLIRYQESLLPKILSKLAMQSAWGGKKLAQLIQLLYHWLNKSNGLEMWATPLVQFMVKRFFLIQKLMISLPHEQIMLTDIRDVLIVSDPFEQLGSSMIVTGEEPVAIKDSDFNRRWYETTYSKEQLTMIENLPVLCAGVTIGSRYAIEQYVREMIEETFNNLPKIVGLLGADQAIHMHLMYKRLQGIEKRIEKNGSGAIATLHYSSLDEFQFANGTITNKKGASLKVVHQYDRHQHLVTYLKNYILAQYHLRADAN
jgi:flagellar biosynthesis protein FliQ